MGVGTTPVAVGPTDHERIGRLTEGTVEIADSTGPEVVLAHAFTEDEYEVARSRPNLDDATPDRVAERNGPTRDLEAVLERAGIGYAIRGTVGDPKERMVELAENTGADVVGGGQERSPAGKALFGSVAQSIMLEASRPGRYVRTGTV